MPTRAINLKLQIPKTEEGRKVRAALWTTHNEVNKAVAEIERILLLCRGERYYTVNVQEEEIEIKESVVKAEALKMARDVQLKNEKKNAGSDEEVLSALRQLYETVVPSILLDDKKKPLSGNAQSIGNSYAGPLCDPETCRIKNPDKLWESGPFAETASKKFQTLPEWFQEIPQETFQKDDRAHFVKIKEKYYQVDLDKANSWFDSQQFSVK